MDPAVERIIRQKARSAGISLSDVANQLIREALDLPPEQDRKRNLRALAGTWTDEEADGFQKTQAVFETIDPDVWK